MSSSVLLDWFGIREREGNYVQFIVVTNFFCGWLYLMAAWGMLNSYKWTSQLLLSTCVMLAVAFIFLLIYINRGGVYETKTVGAMIFRFFITVFFAGIANYIFKKKAIVNNKIQSI